MQEYWTPILGYKMRQVRNQRCPPDTAAVLPSVDMRGGPMTEALSIVVSQEDRRRWSSTLNALRGERKNPSARSSVFSENRSLEV